MFKTTEQRKQFNYNQGRVYSGQGSKFADYKDIGEAFNSYINFKPFAKLNLSLKDFPDFEAGYLEVQAKRLEIQLMLVKAQSTCKEILQDIGFTS